MARARLPSRSPWSRSATGRYARSKSGAGRPARCRSAARRFAPAPIAQAGIHRYGGPTAASRLHYSAHAGARHLRAFRKPAVHADGLEIVSSFAIHPAKDRDGAGHLNLFRHDIRRAVRPRQHTIRLFLAGKRHRLRIEREPLPQAIADIGHVDQTCRHHADLHVRIQILVIAAPYRLEEIAEVPALPPSAPSVERSALSSMTFSLFSPLYTWKPPPSDGHPAVAAIEEVADRIAAVVATGRLRCRSGCRALRTSTPRRRNRTWRSACSASPGRRCRHTCRRWRPRASAGPACPGPSARYPSRARPGCRCRRCRYPRTSASCT